MIEEEIVVETLLGELFSQLPPMVYTDKNKGASSLPVKFDFGNQDDLNLYMETESGNKTPLVWLVQGNKSEQVSTELHYPLKLIIAKNCEQKTARNKKVWNDEIKVYLDPILVNVRKCLQRSGLLFIVSNTDKVYREANYSEYARTADGKTDTKTKTIDHWNVITFECDVIFYENAATNCIPTINFNF